MKYKEIIFSLGLFFLFSCKNTQDKKSESNNKPSLSLEEVKKISKETYIALFPLVYNYGTMYNQAINSQAPEYIGGFGVYKHYGLSTPGGDKEGNWLPTPNGPFYTVLRIYGPREVMLNGTYKFPKIIGDKKN